MKATDFFLVLWWLDHHKEDDYQEHIDGMIEFEDGQDVFAAGLPKSGVPTANEAGVYYSELLPKLKQAYKDAFLADATLTERRTIQVEIGKTETALRQIKEFLFEASADDRLKAKRAAVNEISRSGVSWGMTPIAPLPTKTASDEGIDIISRDDWNGEVPF